MSGNIPNVINSSGDNSASSKTISGGHPVQIIDITPDHKFKLDENALKSILYHPKSKNKKVCKRDLSSNFIFNFHLFE